MNSSYAFVSQTRATDNDNENESDSETTELHSEVLQRTTPTVNADDQPLMENILSKIVQLSDADRSRPHLIVLFSDTLCPMLKYHTELLTEVARVLPNIIDSGKLMAEKGSLQENTAPELERPAEVASARPSGSNLLGIVISLKSERHVRIMMAEPFQLDLFDRKRMADIQVENSPIALRRLLIVDDSWARLQAKTPMIRQGTDDARNHCFQLLKQECGRLEGILSSISGAFQSSLGGLDLVCVLDQSEAELYGVPQGIHGKVLFLVNKDREERPKAVALKTCMHWIDRIFLRSDYSLEWIHANVVPLYVELPDAPSVNLSGQRPESMHAGVGIRLSAKRPLEAHVRVKVRKGEGSDVLESSVLNEIQRTKIFEMQAIRKPMFMHLMGSMSLENRAVHHGPAGQDANPFL